MGKTDIIAELLHQQSDSGGVYHGRIRQRVEQIIAINYLGYTLFC